MPIIITLLLLLFQMRYTLTPLELYPAFMYAQDVAVSASYLKYDFEHESGDCCDDVLGVWVMGKSGRGVFL